LSDILEKCAELRMQVGNAVEFEFEDGTKVAGAISSVFPEEGPVKVATLRNVVIVDGEESVRHPYLSIMTSKLTSVV